MERQTVLGPGETIEAALGQGEHVILATDRRLLVVKVGWTAGATGGGRVAAFDYGDVTGLQANFGMVTGTLSVQSPGFGATQTGDYWSTKNQQSWTDLPNVIAWSKENHNKYSKELAFVDQRIGAAKHRSTSDGVSHPPAGQPGPGLVEQLRQLVELHQIGGLTDQEFTAAKARLLALQPDV